MQIMNPRRSEEDLSNGEQEEVILNEKKRKKMAWLFSPLLDKENEPDWCLNGDSGEIKIQIGSYYYWIRRMQNIFELCRLSVRKDSLILYEIIRHDRFGISDDDLEDAVRKDNGEIFIRREYRISNHIKRKLQILYAP